MIKILFALALVGLVAAFLPDLLGKALIVCLIFCIAFLFAGATKP